MHPGLIYFFGAIILVFLKVCRKETSDLNQMQKTVLSQVFIILTPLLALFVTFLLKPQTAQFSCLFDLPLIFFYVDKMNIFIGYIFVLIGFLSILYAFRTEDDLFFIFSFLYIGSSLGVVFAGDYLTFFIFWEIMALAPTFLVWLGSKNSPAGDEALKAGYRYLVFHFIGGLLLLAGIIIEFTYRPFSSGDPASFLLITPTTRLSFILILLGIGVNAAFILLHTWLPDAYPKASFAASVLMSVYTTKTAVYALARLFPGVPLVAYIGAIMAIYGVTFALMQNSMRKLLSYHIISQVGYMVAAIGIGGDLGVNAGLAHALHHILYKGLLFMCAGAVIYRLGEENLSALGGLAKKMPVTTITALVAALSISGLPLFNGFISKTMISESAHQTHNYTVYLILKLASVGTWLSFLKFTYFGFLRTQMTADNRGEKSGNQRSFQKSAEISVYPQINNSGNQQIKEVPWNMSLPMTIIALLCFFTGVYPKFVLGILPYPIGEIPFYSGHNLFSTAQIYLVTLLIFFLSREYFAPHEISTLDFDYFYRKIAYFFVWFCQGLVAKVDTAYTFAIERLIPYARESWGVTTEKGRVEKMIDNGSGIIVETSERVSLFDKEVIDGTANRLAVSLVNLGKKLRMIQTGYLQNYAGIIFLALLVLILFLLIF